MVDRKRKARPNLSINNRQSDPLKPLYRDGDIRRLAPVKEKNGDKRSAFRRDWARLVHSTSFRRLQGKSQLFPSDENDFFRNRLTHSIEVAQIATGIAIDLNGTKLFAKKKIDVDLVHFAALAHDIGHPPFGHNGERALNELMKDNGGFEGNAQTLRILSRLEKKETFDYPASSPSPVMFEDFRDKRIGLNLTMRSLASVLKYDNIIPRSNDGKVVKGYYELEQEFVELLKESICGDKSKEGFRTVECAIMDLADDIAYSTYDLEDALKGGFLSAASLIAINNKSKADIIRTVNEKMRENYQGELGDEEMLSVEEFNEIIVEILGDILLMPSTDLTGYSPEEVAAISVGVVYARSCELANVGYYRSDFTSKLVYKMIQGIDVVGNFECPALTNVRFTKRIFKTVEMLKRIAFHDVIGSNQVKMAEYRGSEIIGTIFEALTERKGGVQLLPGDWQLICAGSGDKHRTVCDFIAGMTDRYCLEFYSRLVGVNAPSIQKPY